MEPSQGTSNALWKNKLTSNTKEDRAVLQFRCCRKTYPPLSDSWKDGNAHSGSSPMCVSLLSHLESRKRIANTTAVHMTVDTKTFTDFPGSAPATIFFGLEDIRRARTFVEHRNMFKDCRIGQPWSSTRSAKTRAIVFFVLSDTTIKAMHSHGTTMAPSDDFEQAIGMTHRCRYNFLCQE